MSHTYWIILVRYDLKTVMSVLLLTNVFPFDYILYTGVGNYRKKVVSKKLFQWSPAEAPTGVGVSSNTLVSQQIPLAVSHR